MSLLIKNVEVRGQAKDILIEKNRITQIAKEINVPSAEIIDGRKESCDPWTHQWPHPCCNDPAERICR
jgi:dihydroorotase-like cyclic amidohydrolase